MDDSLRVDGRTYVSTKSAASQTGYTSDYVGQLAREGHIPSKKIGRARFVDIKALEDYVGREKGRYQKSAVVLKGRTEGLKQATPDLDSQKDARITPERDKIRPSAGTEETGVSSFLYEEDDRPFLPEIKKTPVEGTLPSNPGIYSANENLRVGNRDSQEYRENREQWRARDLVDRPIKSSYVHKRLRRNVGTRGSSKKIAAFALATLFIFGPYFFLTHPSAEAARAETRETISRVVVAFSQHGVDFIERVQEEGILDIAREYVRNGSKTVLRTGKHIAVGLYGRVPQEVERWYLQTKELVDYQDDSEIESIVAAASSGYSLPEQLAVDVYVGISSLFKKKDAGVTNLVHVEEQETVDIDLSVPDVSEPEVVVVREPIVVEGPRTVVNSVREYISPEHITYTELVTLLALNNQRIELSFTDADSTLEKRLRDIITKQADAIVGSGGGGSSGGSSVSALSDLTVTAGDGISISGDTISADINGLTEDASPQAAGDYIVTYDASAGGLKKVLLNNLTSVGGGDSVSIDSIAVTNPDFVSTGDIDFVDSSNTITANINADSIEVSMFADGDWGDLSVSSNSVTLDADTVSDSEIDYATVTLADFTNDANFIDLTDLSSTATGLTYNNTNGQFSLTAGYVIPLTASTTEWATAFGWGDHGSAGYFDTAGTGLSSTGSTINLDINELTEEVTFESGDFLAFYDTTAGAIRKVDFDALPGAGGGITSLNGLNAATQSFATSSTATGLNIDITSTSSTHTFALSLAAGYVIPLTASTTEWSTAFGWGDHGSAGYLTDITGESIEDLSDVAAMTQATGDLLYWDGAAWSNIATSSLGINSSLWTQTGSDIYYDTGFVGIGTSTPYARLSVDDGAFVVSSTTATSTIAGGLDVGNGGLVYDWSSGVTSIDNIELGSFNFEANAGIVSWVDMPVTSSVATGTIESYRAKIDGQTLLSIYAESDGLGGIQNQGVGIGTTTPHEMLTVAGNGYFSGTLTAATSTLSSLTVSGASTLSSLSLSGSFTDSTGSVGTLGQILQSTGTSTQWVATSTLGLGGGSGTVTSVDLSVPTGLTVSGNPITTSGTLAIALDTGYTIPLTASTTEWSTAFGWGNHASAGYFDTAGTGLTSSSTTISLDINGLTEEAVFQSGDFLAFYDASAGAIRKVDFDSLPGAGGGLTSLNGLSAASQSFATSSTATGLNIDITSTGSTHTFALSLAAGYTIPLTASTTEWSTAFGWGDHSSAGYLTDITGSSLEDLSDVASMTQSTGDLLYWDGAAWSNIATSSLGISTAGLVAADIDTSAELDAIVGDDTGSGALVFGTAPTISDSLVVQDVGTTADLNIVNYSNTSWHRPGLTFGRARGTSTSSPSAVQSGDELFRLTSQARTPSGAWTTSLEWLGIVESAPSGAAVPAYLGLFTSPDGLTPTEKLRITSTGNLAIATTTPLSKLTVYGDAFIEGSNRYLNFGTATGTSGYGFRDNAGTIELKNSGGTWAGILTDITGESLEDLSDVASMTQNTGDLLYWDGAAWSNIATSSLGISGGSGAFASAGGFTTLNTIGDSVGIGTSTPSSKLDVWGNLTVGTSSVPTLRVDTATGRVGIGTSNPSYALDVLTSGTRIRAPLYLTRSDGTNNVLTITNSGSGPVFTVPSDGTSFLLKYKTFEKLEIEENAILFNGSGIDSDLRIQGDNDTHLFFADGGSDRIAIGTTTPLSKLSVYGDAFLEGSSRYLNFGTATGTNGYGIRDNAGTIEFKNSGGSWIAMATSTGISLTDLSSTATGLSYNNTTGEFSLTAGYTIPLTASTTEWSTAFGWGDHSSAGYLADITGSSLEDLSDVASMTQSTGDLLYWDGAAWSNLATSSLGIVTSQWTTSGSDIYFTGGNVGIGTASPVHLLEVAGDAKFANSTGRSLITFGDAGGTLSGSGVYVGRGLYDNILEDALNLGGFGGLTFSVNDTPSLGGTSTPKMVITTAGNVGIGTTTPASKLDVWGNLTVGTSSLPALHVDTSNGKVGIGTPASEFFELFVFGDTWLSDGLFTTSIFGEAFINIFDADFTSDFKLVAASSSDRFYIQDTGTQSELLSILGTGEVGIGTSTPSHLLTVSGDAQITGALYDSAGSSGAAGQVLQSTGTGFSWVATSTLGISGGSGTVTSVDLSVPTGLTVTGNPITTSGTLAIGLDTGYVIPLTASTTEWATAFSWGDHSQAGYLTDITGESIEDLSDVAAMTQTTGDLLYWDGAAWSNIATSSLGISGGSSQWTTTGSNIYFSTGFVGIGTTSPYARLSVDDGALVVSSTTATSTIAGGLDVGNGGLVYDWSSGVTSVSNIELGALGFESDAGIISWIDMPVTSSAAAGTAESYTAQLDGNPLLTIYGKSDGAGGATNLGVGIGTIAPGLLFHIATSSDGDIMRLQDSDGTCDYNPESGAVTVTCSSDETLKENIRDTGSALDYLSTLRIRDYEVIASGDTVTGVVAQEVLLTHPELVSQRENGIYMVSQINEWKIIKAIQELATSTSAFRMSEQELDDALAVRSGATSTKVFRPKIENDQRGLLSGLLGVFGAWIENGVTKFERIWAYKFDADTVRARQITATDTLCVGSTCVTENELRALLGKQPVTPTVPSSTVTPSTPATTTATSTDTTATSTTPTATTTDQQVGGTNATSTDTGSSSIGGQNSNASSNPIGQTVNLPDPANSTGDQSASAQSSDTSQSPDSSTGAGAPATTDDAGDEGSGATPESGESNTTATDSGTDSTDTSGDTNSSAVTE